MKNKSGKEGNIQRVIGVKIFLSSMQNEGMIKKKKKKTLCILTYLIFPKPSDTESIISS